MTTDGVSTLHKMGWKWT